nr:hypothetical protein [Tanacetum cinerariifolium]
MQEDESEPAKVQKVADVVTNTKIITKVVTAASETITAASTTITAAEVQVPAVTLNTAPTRVTAAPSRRGKGVDEVIDHVKKKAKEDPAMKKYQALKRKPQTEAQARKNMMLYLKNVAGFKMDYFKGMSYDDICPVFEAKFNTNVAFLLETKEQIKEEESRALKRLNETLTEKAAKRQKGMFEKPDIHAQIWKNLRSVHGPAKVKGWKLLESCGVQIITFTTTQLILLVERKYPLTRFTLNQMVNVARQEEKESLKIEKSSMKTSIVSSIMSWKMAIMHLWKVLGALHKPKGIRR